ncbi:MAG: nucleotide exchange factor GrpE [Saprospiraceae bacterium]|nr:nucleotide exchange factor GrpE [Saprospiraceae bacterium]
MSKKEPMESQDQIKENLEHQEIIAEQEEASTVEDFFADEQQLSEHQVLLENIQSELKTMQKDHEELKDKYMRLFAEFDNHKKRTIKEKLDLMKTASQDIMTALLPVLDDFDRAKQNEELSDGINLVYQKLYKVLENKGLTPMESNEQPFNAEFHEAITEIAAQSDDLKGKVVDTIEKGYMLSDKIIRHAKVVVGK